MIVLVAYSKLGWPRKGVWYKPTGSARRFRRRRVAWGTAAPETRQRRVQRCKHGGSHVQGFCFSIIVILMAVT